MRYLLQKGIYWSEAFTTAGAFIGEEFMQTEINWGEVFITVEEFITGGGGGGIYCRQAFIGERY